MNLETKLNPKKLVKEIKDFAIGFYEDKPHFYLTAAVTGIYLTYLIKESISK